MTFPVVDQTDRCTTHAELTRDVFLHRNVFQCRYCVNLFSGQLPADWIA